MATVVGCMVIVVFAFFFWGLATDPTSWPNRHETFVLVVDQVHGLLYMIFLVVAAMLARDTAHSVVVSNTTLLGANKFNELRFQYSFEERPRLGQSNDFPTVVINDTGSFGKRFFLPITSDHARIQITDNFSYLFGDHDLKFGFDFQSDNDSQYFAGFADGRYEFRSIDSFNLIRKTAICSRVTGLAGQ